MILAGDIGGTKTNLALFEGGAHVPFELATFRSQEHAGLDSMVETFLEAHPVRVERACFGIAGPVIDGRTEAINLAWPVDSRSLAKLLGLPSVGLLNDLEANAWGVARLGPEDFAILNEGQPADGNAAVISAGTGLGQAGLFWDGERHRPFATEGGHIDFAPRTEEEVELWRFLRAELGHVSYERVCSGMGIVNLFRFFLHSGSVTKPQWYVEAPDKAAAISEAAARGDETARRAHDLFVSIYGAQAGNLALTVMASGGVFVGGGIAPKNIERLKGGPFMAAFLDKGRFRALLERMPVKVILNDRTALLGAARCAVEAP